MNKIAEDKLLDSLFTLPAENNIAGGPALNGLDWDYIRGRFSEEKIPQALLYRMVKKSGIFGQLPGYLQSDLWQAYLSTFAKNTVHLNEFIRIQSLFEANHIEVMPLKGMALLFCVFKDIALRPMADIDILIKKEDAQKADNLLLGSGYTHNCGPFEYSRIKSDIPVCLDMQYEIWYLKTMSKRRCAMYGIEQIWRDARRIYLDDGSSAKIMLPEDLLINVAAHAALDHSRPTWIWLNDIAAICRAYKDRMTWSVLLDKITSYSLEVPFYRLFKSVKDEFDAEIPQFIIDKLKPGKNKFFEAKLQDLALKSPAVTWLGHLLRIFTNSRLSGKIRLILFYLFPDKEFMIERYKIRQKRFVYFYYPLRVIIFIKKTIAVFAVFLWCRKVCSCGAQVKHFHKPSENRAEVIAKRFS